MYTLYIDESGKSNLFTIDAQNPNFVLAGLIVADSDKAALKIKADQIKFKYWNRTDIVLHATELRGKRGVFGLLGNRKGALDINAFYKDILVFLQDAAVYLAIQGVNKVALSKDPAIATPLLKADKNNKNDIFYKTIVGVQKGLVKKTSYNLLITYLAFLKNKNMPGRVVIESTGDPQDLHVFSSYNVLMNSGYKGFSMSAKNIRQFFTSISFVTKINHDIETQIADLAAYYLSLERKAQDGIETIQKGSYEEQLINVFRAKDFSVVVNAGNSALSSLQIVDSPIQYK